MRNAGKIMTVAAAALCLAACASSQVASPYPAGDGPTYPAPNPVAAPSSTAAPSTSAGHACTADDVKVSGDVGAKPTVTIPDTCTAPTTLLTKDLKAGTGAAATTGSTLGVTYDLVTWSDKKDFGFQSFSFALGENQAIAGWDQGLAGIRQGGRRLVIVPPNLATGSIGNQSVKPDETLVFVIDAVQVTG
ncbi:MAG TPA: FKBP-type peptidyl-prolyl cis-trans isomerase [Amycolatopsis sp.]|uniref:FKBP-type peptidyl-prolyl cis-trans isomerase n=1 Tax=Amycolatopsis sp. TaxID=37632 RepID=UPI002B47418D|nr:FKBP-type peptidyl-prolyl cis-trans isomerase [Amycolatopsis sp.]HKS49894.1 FKBP-type peptidyl-prolyl cis-trans isomerase [Amycolatopsis sp.]